MFLLNTCSNPKNELYLLADDMDGLKTSSPVYYKGVEVGQISSIEFPTYGKIIARITFDQDLRLHNGTTVTINQKDFLGTKGIDIEDGLGIQPLSYGDTLQVTDSPPKFNLPIDSITTKVTDFISDITGKKKEDSLLIEIRRLNENLERLERNKTFQR